MIVNNVAFFQAGQGNSAGQAGCCRAFSLSGRGTATLRRLTDGVSRIDLDVRIDPVAPADKEKKTNYCQVVTSA